MKFSNGCWLNQPDTMLFAPAEVYSAEIESERVRLLCPAEKIRQRGDTLGGVVLTIEITAPLPDVLRVRAVHFAGAPEPGPAFELRYPVEGLLKAEQTDDEIVVRSGKLALNIDRRTAAMRFSFDGRRLTGLSGRDLAYVRTDWQGSHYYNPTSENAYMRCQLDLSVNEHIYGLGEQFGPLVKNGQRVVIRNEDGGTSTDQAYKNIPFFLSSRGYGVFVNHPETVEFEVGSDAVNKTGFCVRGERLDFFMIGGAEPKEALMRYTDLTGKPGLPAPWTFGLWLSTSFTTDYDEATVNSFVDGMRQRGIPLSVFHFDCFWMRAFRWCDFTFDPDMFPDPKGMLSRLKEKGLKICLWINPYIAQASSLFDEGMKKGYFVRRRDGGVWQWDMWQPGMALVDFTNPDAVRWYQDKLRALIDVGADCFKTDFGERIPTDCVYFDGSDPEKMHNYYTYLYNKAVWEVLSEAKGEPVLFARSATAGGQKFPVHWGGDCWSNYESMEQSLRGGLSLTSSGFGFWSHDIGGFEQKSTADVYKRWLAFGLLSTHSRLHGSGSYRVPWSYDDEAVDVARFFTRLKAKLMPYLWRCALYTHETGVPMMRSMPLEFPDDHACDYLSGQYMLGDSLLVAPVMSEDGVAEFYLPEGVWTDVLTGKEVQGGRRIRAAYDYMSIPLYARPGSVVPFGAHDDGPVYDYADGVEWRVYAPIDGHTCGAVVRDAEGVAVSELSVRRDGDVLRVRYQGEKPCSVTVPALGASVAFEASGEAQLSLV